MGNTGASQEADVWTVSKAVWMNPGGVGGVTLHTEGRAETQRWAQVGGVGVDGSIPRGTRLTGFNVFSLPPPLDFRKMTLRVCSRI